jgi:hypothetical protein
MLTMRIVAKVPIEMGQPISKKSGKQAIKPYLLPLWQSRIETLMLRSGRCPVRYFAKILPGSSGLFKAAPNLFGWHFRVGTNKRRACQRVAKNCRDFSQIKELGSSTHPEPSPPRSSFQSASNTVPSPWPLVKLTVAHRHGGRFAFSISPSPHLPIRRSIACCTDT